MSKIAHITKDTGLVLDDGNTYGSSDVGQVGSADKVFDFGADWADKPDYDIDMRIISAKGSDTSETYLIAFQQSDTLAHTIVKNQEIFTLAIGASVEKRIRFRVTLKQRYARMYYTLGGASPSLVVKRVQAISGTAY